jgi:hypothetical protein
MSEIVSIGGRQFKIGATYRYVVPELKREPRYLERFDTSTKVRGDPMNRPGGTVDYRTWENGRLYGYGRCSAVQWAKWAGEEIQP